jgi:DegV family protein with EDD domain
VVENNMDIHIVTDSTCDLPHQTVVDYKIEVIPLLINQGENSFLDGVNLSREEFYHRLPGFKPAPQTAAPGPEIFRQAFEKLADEGAKFILSIHISEKLSATINSARVAAEQFKHVPVIVLDSGQLSLGLGFLVEKAAQIAIRDHPFEEIVTCIEETMK